MNPILLQPPVLLPAVDDGGGGVPAEIDAMRQPIAPPARVSVAGVMADAAPVELHRARRSEPIVLAPPAATADSALAADAVEAIAIAPAQRVPRRGIFRIIGGAIASAAGWLFGSLSLIIGLAVLAATPIMQFLSLGYLLEAAGRIGRTGRFRDGFPGVRVASRIGRAVIGAVLVLAPWYICSEALDSAALIDPDSPQTHRLGVLVTLLAVLTPIHLVLALVRGGKFRYFLWPFNFVWFVRRLLHGGYFREARDSIVTLVRSLHLQHYFWLGLRGYVAAGLILAVPSTLYVIGKLNVATLFFFAIPGWVLLTAALLYVPFLEVHFASENRFRAMFEIGVIRERFRRAPIAFFIALLFTLVLALPLYLFKIEVVPRDALWLPAVLFIVTIFPVKVMAGWAYARAGRRPRRAWFITRLGCRLLMLPIALLYAFIVFFTQYTGWHGALGLYEHHAFLLPVPF